MSRHRFRDYLLVSGGCLLLNNIILVAMDCLGAPLAASVAVSFVTLVVIGYPLHGRITFRCALGPAPFARYAVAMAANLPSSVAALWLWRDVVGLRMVFAAPISSACLTLLNFALCRFVVFGRWPAWGGLSSVNTR